METCRDGYKLAFLLTGPHSLGKSVEWKHGSKKRSRKSVSQGVPTRWGNQLNGNQAVREWHLRYAAVHFYEKRLYLAAWCEEDQPSDLPELAHNACFRFDRIIEVSPIEAEWRNAGLATATVHLALYSTLIKAYEKREEDTVQMDGDRLLVERLITNSFWFVRSILPYGEECEILAPESVRTQMSERFKKAANLYA